MFEKQLNMVWIRYRIWIRNRNFSNVGTRTAINRYRYCSTTLDTWHYEGTSNTGTSWSPFHLMRKKSSPGSLVAPIIGASDYEHDRWWQNGYWQNWSISIFVRDPDFTVVSPSRSGFGIRIRIQEGKKVLNRLETKVRCSFWRARGFSWSWKAYKVKLYQTFIQKSCSLFFFPTEIFPISKTLEQCCGSGMFIPDPGSWFLPIPDPKTATKERGEKKN